MSCIIVMSYLALSAEQDNQPAEGSVQQRDVSASYQFMQEQIQQARDTVATLLLPLKPTEKTSSQLLTVF